MRQHACLMMYVLETRRNAMKGKPLSAVPWFVANIRLVVI
jgi:hypothetical protein